MAAPIQPAVVESRQVGSDQVVTYTWGLPTAVASPGNIQGNTPENESVLLPTFAALATGAICTPVYCAGAQDRCVQVTGTPGANLQIALKGSNDGVTFVTLRDRLGALTDNVQAGDFAQILSTTAWVVPVLAGGDGTTAVNVIMVVRFVR